MDLAAVELDFEGFRALALNENLSANEKIGFPDSYREGFEAAILADIQRKLPGLGQPGCRVLDIGPGCAGLPRKIMSLCAGAGGLIALVDSPEMLAQLPEGEHVIKTPGLFPRNLADVRGRMPQADVIICYSVLHYIFLDTNLFGFVDAVVELLAPGGRALIGDIPNQSKRRRFFASEAGRAFHAHFTGSTTAPEVSWNAPTPGKIDDAVLIGLMQRAQAAGCDAYLMPQAADLPMQNRRDDLLIVKP